MMTKKIKPHRCLKAVYGKTTQHYHVVMILQLEARSSRPSVRLCHCLVVRAAWLGEPWPRWEAGKPKAF